MAAACGCVTTAHWQGSHDTQVGADGGQTAVVAAKGAYVGGGHGVVRLNGQQGHKLPHSPGGQHAAHPLNVAGIIPTASKVSIFFMFLYLLRKQRGITAPVALSDHPIQTGMGGVGYLSPSAREGRLSNSTPGHAMCKRNG